MGSVRRQAGTSFALNAHYWDEKHGRRHNGESCPDRNSSRKYQIISDSESFWLLDPRLRDYFFSPILPYKMFGKFAIVRKPLGEFARVQNGAGLFARRVAA